MKKLLFLAAVMLIASPASAVTIDFANFIDNTFGEQAVEDGREITFGDLKITFRAAIVSGVLPPLTNQSLTGSSFDYTTADMSTTNATFAYFDQGGAGVGATSEINNTNDSNLGPGKKTDRQAKNSADDNVAVGNGGRQVLVLEFDAVNAADERDVKISGLTFKDLNHNTNFGDAVLDITGDDGSDWNSYGLSTLTSGGDPNLEVAQGSRMGLAYAYPTAGINANAGQHQFYLSTLTWEFADPPSGGAVPEPATLACIAPILGLAFARRRKKA